MFAHEVETSSGGLESVEDEDTCEKDAGEEETGGLQHPDGEESTSGMNGSEEGRQGRVGPVVHHWDGRMEEEGDIEIDDKSWLQNATLQQSSVCIQTIDLTGGIMFPPLFHIHTCPHASNVESSRF